MQDEPHPPEILHAVADFLRQIVVPQTTGATAYQARIAAAALDLVRRQLEQAGKEAAEQDRLRALLNQDGPLPTLTAELARRLRDGTLDLASPGVAAHLWAATRDKLAVDQPRYWGLPPIPEDAPP